MGVSWPVGVAVSPAPIAVGVVLVRCLAPGDSRGKDGLRVVTGVLAFFVLLDVVVGLGGRYDLIAGALARRSLCGGCTAEAGGARDDHSSDRTCRGR